jgi:hypothetical protein
VGVRTAGPPASDAQLRRAASLASAGAAAIHLGAAHAHFHEWGPAGVFMLASGIAQLAWAVWAALDARRPALWAAGVGGNLGIVGVWVVSRTAGLPFGPEPWVAESIHTTDMLATLLEVVIVVAGVALLRPAHRRPGRRLVELATTGAVLSAIASAEEPAHERAVAVATLLLAVSVLALVSALSRSLAVREVRRSHGKASLVRRRPDLLDARPGASVGARV